MGLCARWLEGAEVSRGQHWCAGCVFARTRARKLRARRSRGAHSSRPSALLDYRPALTRGTLAHPRSRAICATMPRALLALAAVALLLLAIASQPCEAKEKKKAEITHKVCAVLRVLRVWRCLPGQPRGDQLSLAHLLLRSLPRSRLPRRTHSTRSTLTSRSTASPRAGFHRRT